MLRVLLKKMSILSILGDSMKFTVCNASFTSDMQPCDGAVCSPVTLYTVTTDNPNGEECGYCRLIGDNENGTYLYEFYTNKWVIDINSLEELIRLKESCDKLEIVDDSEVNMQCIVLINY